MFPQVRDAACCRTVTVPGMPANVGNNLGHAQLHHHRRITPLHCVLRRKCSGEGDLWLVLLVIPLHLHGLYAARTSLHSLSVCEVFRFVPVLRAELCSWYPGTCPWKKTQESTIYRSGGVVLRRPDGWTSTHPGQVEERLLKQRPKASVETRACFMTCYFSHHVWATPAQTQILGTILIWNVVQFCDARSIAHARLSFKQYLSALMLPGHAAVGTRGEHQPGLRCPGGLPLASP